MVEPRLQQREETLVSIAAVQKYWHTQLGGHRQLSAKRDFLLGWRGEVAVEVQAALAHCHHFGLVHQRIDSVRHLRRPAAAVMWMHACR